MKKILMTLAVTPLLLTSCTTTDEDPYPNIKIVDAASVYSCKHVGNLSTTSTTPYGFWTETARESIVKMAKKEAYKLNANRVVLDGPTTGDDAISVNGKAYLCQP